VSDNIIQHLSEVIPDHLRKGVQEELLRGWKMEETQAKHQARQLGAFYHQNDAKNIEGMGRLVGEIPTASYHYWGKRLGYDCWKDDEFVREFFRDNPECAVKNYVKNASINGAIFTADGHLMQ
jgi:hypothetical protein